MTTQLPPEFRTETFEFEADTTDGNTPDLWIEETFINQWDDERAVLGGDTYDAKEIIKFDWETTHHDFDGNRNEWIVDADALPELGQKLEDNGYEVAFEAPDEGDEPEALTDLTAFAEEGDRIEVEYQQKNGNGTNTKEGEIDTVYGGDDDTTVGFVRDDGQRMYVKTDEFGEVALFTAGSHAPFVGNTVEVTVEK
jgi:hypothetical protein